MMAIVEQERELTAEPASRPWTAVLHDWVTTVDHKKIGIMYVLMAVLFLVIGGCQAGLIPLQLFLPRREFLRPGTLNGLVSQHGTTLGVFTWIADLIGI